MRYCQLAGSDPAGWYLLGAALHAQRLPADALVCMERSLGLEPKQPEVIKATAILLYELQRYGAGMDQAVRVCEITPEDPNAWLIAGSLLEAMQKGEEALQCYERSLKLHSAWPPALLNRGALLMGMGKYRHALENYRRLVKTCPDQADSYFNLAEAQLACGDFEDAAMSCRQALRLSPQHSGANIDLAVALSMLGEFDTARQLLNALTANDPDAVKSHFERVATVSGDDPNLFWQLQPEDLFLWQHGEQQKCCDWRHRKRFLEAMLTRADALESGACSGLAFPAIYYHALSLPIPGRLQLALARGVSAAVSSRVERGQNVRRPLRYRKQATPLRIGYLSPDYRLHPVAYLHWRQMALHDRDRFHVYAYSLSQSDNSEIGEKVRSSCDEWRSCENDPVQLTAARIRYDGIHMLVDLSGYTRATRPEILAMRPAPIQVAYMGMPATSGASFIDYRITDRITTPAEQAADWPERLVHFPSTLFIYNDQQVIAAPPSREDFGLPQNAFVFCCFNNTFKIEPDVFRIWMRLLQRHPQSVLWLLSDNELAKDNLRREAHARGVDPERLVFATFLPFSEHLARYALADLFLDTFYYGAHTTAADALWGGLPVLTCLGETMAARQAASIVNAAGLPDMIVTSQEAYEALASHLASHHLELAGIKRRLRENRRKAPLFNTVNRVRELEYAFEMMWQRHLAGLPPEGFAVPSSDLDGT